jgi:hypothetical protein
LPVTEEWYQTWIDNKWNYVLISFNNQQPEVFEKKQSGNLVYIGDPTKYSEGAITSNNNEDYFFTIIENNGEYYVTFMLGSSCD